MVLCCLLAFVVGPATANKKTGLFQRLTQALQSDGSNAQEELNAAVSGLTDTGLPDAPFLQDTWAQDDDGLSLIKPAFDGDVLSVFRTLTENYKDQLQEIWGQPEVAKALLTNFPMFSGIKGMASIAQKEGPLTSADGLSALSAFTDYLAATARVLEEVMDPGKFAAKMQTYQSLKDPVLKDLVARTEKGDVEATLALQQEIVNRELGDIIDLEAFGIRGLEPAAVSSLRNMIKDTEPALYKLILTDDKIAQKFMDDPSAAYREAQALSPSLAEAAKVLASGGTRR
ncbi:hypothetical protein VYU27_000441 [Nannochloropsis oceanica]